MSNSHHDDFLNTTRTYLSELGLSAYNRHSGIFESNLEKRYLAEKALNGSFDEEEYQAAISGQSDTKIGEELAS